MREQEKGSIPPEQELEFALDGIQKGDWADANHCLEMFISKKDYLTSEQKTKLQAKLVEIQNAIGDVPEEYKNKIETNLQEVSGILK